MFQLPKIAFPTPFSILTLIGYIIDPMDRCRISKSAGSTSIDIRDRIQTPTGGTRVLKFCNRVLSHLMLEGNAPLMGISVLDIRIDRTQAGTRQSRRARGGRKRSEIVGGIRSRGN